MNSVGVSIVVQHLKCLGVAFLGRHEQRRGAVLLRRVEVGAELRESPQRLRVSLLACDVHGRGTVFVWRLDVGAELRESLQYQWE